ncbi:MAG: hypothetical protein KatS3mg126_2485 [Lysobacteraceae bacterium]|nr:MAG: hypothetical protein KatS3mg126_2485 [Xanthomonadaceae bacterium]
MAEVALAAADDAGRAEPAAAPPPPPQPAPEPAAAEAEAFARDLLADLPAPEQADAEAVLAALSNRLEAQADALPEAERRRLRRRLADHAARVARHRAKTLDQAWTEARERLLAALEAGHPGPAREALQRCAELAGDEARQRALNAWRARLAELERWQHWADRQARARLCEQAAALHGSGLHPDALATRIRELQEAWEQLDAVDGKAAPGLERRFRAHCARALAPARPYFEKRDALRQQHAAEVEALVERSAELPEEAGALRTLRGELVAALRELHRLPPGQRRRFGQALRERLDAVEQAIRAAQEAAALAKRRRLARLRRELGASAPELRLALARKAQAEWQTLPRADRATEQELRTELAQLLDPLFAGEQARRRQHDARQAEAEAAATAILDELSALAAAPPERLLQARAQLEQLEARWRALVPTPDPAPRSDRRGRPRRPHPLESRYRKARDAAEAALALALQQQQKASIHALLEAGALLDALDAALDAERAPLRDRLQTLPLHPEDRAALEPRLASGAVSALDPEQAERLVVEAELLAGVDSPSGSAALRRTLQMQRLARRLEGEPEAPPGEALRSLLRQLQASPLADPAQRQALLQRWQLAWEAIAR